MNEDNVLYEEKTSRLWFFGILIFTIILAVILYSAMPALALIPLLIVLVAFLVMFGSSFKMHENSMIIRIFFKNHEVFYNDIGRIGLGMLFEKKSGNISKNMVKTDNGEEFHPNTILALSVSPFKKGVIFYMKNGEKIFCRFKDTDKVLSILKGKINQRTRPQQQAEKLLSRLRKP